MQQCQEKECCCERMKRRYLCRSCVEVRLFSLTATARQEVYPFVTFSDKLGDTYGVELMKPFCLFETVSRFFSSMRKPLKCNRQQ
jgi:hypothetical protein